MGCSKSKEKEIHSPPPNGKLQRTRTLANNNININFNNNYQVNSPLKQLKTKINFIQPLGEDLKTPTNGKSTKGTKFNDADNKEEVKIVTQKSCVQSLDGSKKHKRQKKQFKIIRNIQNDQLEEVEVNDEDSKLQDCINEESSIGKKDEAAGFQVVQIGQKKDKKQSNEKITFSNYCSQQGQEGRVKSRSSSALDGNISLKDIKEVKKIGSSIQRKQRSSKASINVMKHSISRLSSTCQIKQQQEDDSSPKAVRNTNQNEPGAGVDGKSEKHSKASSFGLNLKQNNFFNEREEMNNQSGQKEKEEDVKVEDIENEEVLIQESAVARKNLEQKQTESTDIHNQLNGLNTDCSILKREEDDILIQDMDTQPNEETFKNISQVNNEQNIIKNLETIKSMNQLSGELDEKVNNYLEKLPTVESPTPIVKRQSFKKCEQLPEFFVDKCPEPSSSRGSDAEDSLSYQIKEEDSKGCKDSHINFEIASQINGGKKDEKKFEEYEVTNEQLFSGDLENNNKIRLIKLGDNSAKYQELQNQTDSVGDSEDRYSDQIMIDNNEKPHNNTDIQTQEDLTQANEVFLPETEQQIPLNQEEEQKNNSQQQQNQTINRSNQELILQQEKDSSSSSENMNKKDNINDQDKQRTNNDKNNKDPQTQKNLNNNTDQNSIKQEAKEEEILNLSNRESLTEISLGRDLDDQPHSEDDITSITVIPTESEQQQEPQKKKLPQKQVIKMSQFYNHRKSISLSVDSLDSKLGIGSPSKQNQSCSQSNSDIGNDRLSSTNRVFSFQFSETNGLLKQQEQKRTSLFSPDQKKENHIFKPFELNENKRESLQNELNLKLQLQNTESDEQKIEGSSENQTDQIKKLLNLSEADNSSNTESVNEMSKRVMMDYGKINEQNNTNSENILKSFGSNEKNELMQKEQRNSNQMEYLLDDAIGKSETNSLNSSASNYIEKNNQIYREVMINTNASEQDKMYFPSDHIIQENDNSNLKQISHQNFKLLCSKLEEIQKARENSNIEEQDEDDDNDNERNLKRFNSEKTQELSAITALRQSKTLKPANKKVIDSQSSKKDNLIDKNINESENKEGKTNNLNQLPSNLHGNEENNDYQKNQNKQDNNIQNSNNIQNQIKQLNTEQQTLIKSSEQSKVIHSKTNDNTISDNIPGDSKQFNTKGTLSTKEINSKSIETISNNTIQKEVLKTSPSIKVPESQINNGSSNCVSNSGKLDFLDVSTPLSKLNKNTDTLPQLNKTGQTFLEQSLSIGYPDQIISVNQQDIQTKLKAQVQGIGQNQQFTDSEFPSNEKSFANNIRKFQRANGLLWKRVQTFKENVRKHSGIKLFGLNDSISVKDTVQGWIANCYFVASLTCLAQYPTLVRRLFNRINIIIDNSALQTNCQTNQYQLNQCYSVNMCIDGQWQTVLIDDNLPCRKNDSDPIFCKFSSETKAYWTSLLEKAYAKFKGNYQSIEGGKNRNGSSDAVIDMTGAPSKHIRFQNHTKEEVWKLIHEGNQKGYLLTTMLKDEVENEIDQQEQQELNKQNSNGSLDGQAKSNGLISNHAYSILDTDEIDHIRILKLKNPWGKTEWNGKWSDQCQHTWTESLKERHQLEVANDGIFWMSFCDYYDNFGNCCISYVNKDYYYSSLCFENSQTTEKQITTYTLNPIEQSTEGYFIIYQNREHLTEEYEKNQYVNHLVKIHEVSPDGEDIIKQIAQIYISTTKFAFTEINFEPSKRYKIVIVTETPSNVVLAFYASNLIPLSLKNLEINCSHEILIKQARLLAKKEKINPNFSVFWVSFFCDQDYIIEIYNETTDKIYTQSIQFILTNLKSDPLLQDSEYNQIQVKPNTNIRYIFKKIDPKSQVSICYSKYDPEFTNIQ